MGRLVAVRIVRTNDFLRPLREPFCTQRRYTIEISNRSSVVTQQVML
jgi:hypothetical protein